MLSLLRSAFFGFGLFITLCGGSLLVVDKLLVNVTEASDQTPDFKGIFSSSGPHRQRVVDPPDWMSFSFLSIGGVTMLYSLALPRKPR